MVHEFWNDLSWWRSWTFHGCVDPHVIEMWSLMNHIWNIWQMTYYTLCFETYIYIYIIYIYPFSPWTHTHTHREALGQLWIMSCCPSQAMRLIQPDHLVYLHVMFDWWIAQIGMAEKDPKRSGVFHQHQSPVFVWSCWLHWGSWDDKPSAILVTGWPLSPCVCPMKFTKFRLARN